MDKTERYVRNRNRGFIWVSYYVPFVMSAAFFALGAADQLKGNVNAACYSLGGIFAAAALLCFILYFPYKKSDCIDYENDTVVPKNYGVKRILFHLFRLIILAAAVSLSFTAAYGETEFWISLGVSAGCLLATIGCALIIKAKEKKEKTENEKD